MDSAPGLSMIKDGFIYKALSGFYYVKSEEGTTECRARGRFRLDKSTPLVGDNVSFKPTEHGKGLLTEIHPRKNSFVRPPLANIDKMVIIASEAIPVTDTFLIDRMTAIAADSDCEPVICINKTDIDAADKLYSIYSDVGYTTVRTSALTGEGICSLVDVIDESICAFTGNSGVGKSSILNAIEPDFGISVGDISKKLGRGRHTTRHVELYRLSCGALVADTPGFSAFDSSHLTDKDRLQFLFPEFETYIGSCRYLDCAHIKEPDCAITDALKNGKLQQTRYESYVRLYEQALEYKEWEHRQ
ncbi:MAG: ribosome small subunit-dependent GTPase A [Oscillospiraceae bacterium]|nr:ribosome small subunit-dependent GTPase A [Oscillospiraceae bacterium]